ncbi:hypothetical protein GQ42DRAFT_162444 [Ramicandelaber brevisporus]|nr:hypothetical protein GQ42DRAFT_162444 [Ramicandelaber brevisporus]
MRSGPAICSLPLFAVLAVLGSLVPLASAAGGATSGNSTTPGTPDHPSGILAGANPLLFNASNPLPLFIVQTLVIVTLTRVLGVGLSYLREPLVIAEVIGGILLGPSALGRIPGFKDNLFPTQSLPLLSLVANLGLVLFLFMVGLELDPRVLKKNVRTSLTISLAGIALPFGLGVGVSTLLYRNLSDSHVQFTSFMLFLGVAFSITAFPVLARILTELKLLRTHVGSVTMSAAAVDDVTAWCMLALVVSILRADVALNALYVCLIGIGFVLVMLFLVRPLLVRSLKRIGGFNEQPSQMAVFIVLALALASAFFTDYIGIHAIFGGFLAGVIVPHDAGLAIKITEKIEDMVHLLFLPLYFALSGLKTDVTTLNNGKAWGLMFLVIAVDFLGKVVGCGTAARICKFSWRQSLTIGVLMSCKGLVELIVLNIGLQAGVLNTTIFTMMVIGALVSTCATSPLVQLIYPPHLRTYIDDTTLAGSGAESQDSPMSATESSAGDLDNVDDIEDTRPNGQLAAIPETDEKHGAALPSGAHVRPAMPVRSTSALSVYAHSLRVLLYVDRIQRIPAVVALLTLVRDTTHTHARPHTPTSASNHLAVPSAAPRPHNHHFVRITAMRVIELSERASDIMRSAAIDVAARVIDPAMNLLTTLAQIYGVKLSASVATAPAAEIAQSISEAAARLHPNQHHHHGIHGVGSVVATRSGTPADRAVEAGLGSYFAEGVTPASTTTTSAIHHGTASDAHKLTLLVWEGAGSVASVDEEFEVSDEDSDDGDVNQPTGTSTALSGAQAGNRRQSLLRRPYHPLTSVTSDTSEKPKPPNTIPLKRRTTATSTVSAAGHRDARSGDHSSAVSLLHYRTYTAPQYAQLVLDVFQRTPGTVAVFVDRGFCSLGHAIYPHATHAVTDDHHNHHSHVSPRPLHIRPVESVQSNFSDHPVVGTTTTTESTPTAHDSHVHFTEPHIPLTRTKLAGGDSSVAHIVFIPLVGGRDDISALHLGLRLFARNLSTVRVVVVRFVIGQQQQQSQTSSDAAASTGHWVAPSDDALLAEARAEIAVYQPSSVISLEVVSLPTGSDTVDAALSYAAVLSRTDLIIAGRGVLPQSFGSHSHAAPSGSDPSHGASASAAVGQKRDSAVLGKLAHACLHPEYRVFDEENDDSHHIQASLLVVGPQN